MSKINQSLTKMNKIDIDKYDIIYDIYENKNINSSKNKTLSFIKDNVVYIKKLKFTELLPDYLKHPGNAKDKKVKKWLTDGLTIGITRDQFMELLYMQHDGNEFKAFYYLIKVFRPDNLNIDSTSIFDSKKGFNYRAIRQETYFIYVIIDALSKHPFICQYMHTKYMKFGFQDRIEDELLPKGDQSKFDLWLSLLHILLEINEYYHELVLLANGQPKETQSKKKTETIKNDERKESLSVLCGTSLSSLRIQEVFGVSEKEFKKLTNDEIHKKLNTSVYLKDFINNFSNEVLAALLDEETIRNDYIMYNFKIILQEIRLSYYECRKHMFEKTGKYLKSDTRLIKEIEDMIHTTNLSDEFVIIFLFKDMCMKSDNGYAITFNDLLKFLKIRFNKKDINRVIKSLRKIGMIRDIDFDRNAKRFSFEDLLTIVFKFEMKTELKDTLHMYLVYVGKTYEHITKLINSHNKKLICNRKMLINYTDHLNEKLLDDFNQLDVELTKTKIELTKTSSNLAWYIKNFSSYRLNTSNNYVNDIVIVGKDPTELIQQKVANIKLQLGHTILDVSESDSDLDSESNNSDDSDLDFD